MGDTPNCFPIEFLLYGGSGDDPAAVARAHNGATGFNTLDWEYPQSGTFVKAEAIDPSDAKRDGGAGWVAQSAQPGSGAADAAKNYDPGSTGSSQTGAQLGSSSGAGSGGDDSASAGAAASGAAMGALW